MKRSPRLSNPNLAKDIAWDIVHRRMNLRKYGPHEHPLQLGKPRQGIPPRKMQVDPLLVKRAQKLLRKQGR